MDLPNELKHWGILNMKWGIRRFQNPDGSLTPEGRIRYGVGLPRNSANVGSAMSDNELKNMTYRYKNEANFYRARNDYLEQEAKYKALSNPPKKTSQFMQKVFIQPIENVMGKNVEFGLMAAGASFVGSVGSKYADDYMSYMFKNHNNNNSGNGNNNNNNNNNNYNNNNNNKYNKKYA